LDESKEQDKRIMDYQRALSAGSVNKEEQEKATMLLQNCQRILQPVKVINPYAELLELPQAVFKPRRTNAHYLQFIEVITFYHQFQREQKSDETTGEIFIETTLEDIENANRLLKEILLRKSDELTGACRNYLEDVKTYLAERDGKISSLPGSGQFSNREIRRALKINESNQKRHTLNLLSSYYIKRVKGSKSKGYLYEVVSYEEFKTLKEQIGNVLDETLKKLKPISERSSVVQKENEPRKANKNKAVKA